ncbi:dihydrofolate reductase family protein [Lihuaxuella thermophila]|uniref:dihydrofolate reductase family protein n=1 Tax=Lihuaxuella thermophila TaxID=1173111 RepID=UPI000B7DBBFC
MLRGFRLNVNLKKAISTMSVKCSIKWGNRSKKRSPSGDKNVGAAGANIAGQCIKAGLLDEIQIHLVPVLLGNGVRLFKHLGTDQIKIEKTKLIEAPGVTHLRFRVVK